MDCLHEGTTKCANDEFDDIIAFDVPDFDLPKLLNEGDHACIVGGDILNYDDSSAYNDAWFEQVDRVATSTNVNSSYDDPPTFHPLLFEQTDHVAWDLGFDYGSQRRNVLPTRTPMNAVEQKQKRRKVTAWKEEQREMFVAENTGMQGNEEKRNIDLITPGLLTSDGSLMALPCSSTTILDMPQNHGPKEEQPRKEGKNVKRWSDEEHTLFLKGMKIYGEGNWKDISENVLKTRTPLQICSHAQKYFLRQKQDRLQRKRKSINDINNV